MYTDVLLFENSLFYKYYMFLLVKDQESITVMRLHVITAINKGIIQYIINKFTTQTKSVKRRRERNRKKWG